MDPPRVRSLEVSGAELADLRWLYQQIMRHDDARP